MEVFINSLVNKITIRHKRRWLALLCAVVLAGVSAPAHSFEPFVVEDIRIDGLRRFNPGVVFNRIGVEIGDTIRENKSIEIIKVLFDSGFFRSVDVLRDGNVLVIAVVENPTIAEVDYSGINEVPDEALVTMLKNAGIVKARVFDRALVEAAVKALEDIYTERSFYQAKIRPVISPLPRNRVALLLEVEEGPQAAIRSIEIDGNEALSDWLLKREMNLSPRGIFSFFGDSHLFSEARLAADLERIRTLYLQEGYLRFEVEAQEVEVSDDKINIDIKLRLNEGRQYLLAEPEGDVFSGDIPAEIEQQELLDLIRQEPGDVFSSRESAATVAAIRDLLGNFGYAFAEVSYDNALDDDTGTVAVTYDIVPGRLTYVSEIRIVGNERTRDEVIRRELLQFERERYSREKVERSRRRLRRLGFFQDVVIEQEAVEGRDDELNLLVRVTESGLGNFHIGAGLSSDNNLSFQGGITTPNVFGSGNNFSADLALGDDDKRINLSLDELYHTDEGISRHVGVSISEQESASNSSSYNIDGFSARYGYAIPYADDGKYDVNLVYEKIKINSVAAPYRPFQEKHGNDLDLLLLRGGLTHDTRNSSQYPTDGFRAAVSGEIGLPILDLKYYQINYLHDYYYEAASLPLAPVWHLRGGLGFGDSYGGDVYPFYRRFFIGGSRVLRGFKNSSIGGDLFQGNATGATSRIYGSAEAAINVDIFKNQQIYVVPFLDFGATGDTSLSLEPWRASAGLEIRWISPIGPLRFSWGSAVLNESSDKLQRLQFSVSY